MKLTDLSGKRWMLTLALLATSWAGRQAAAAQSEPGWMFELPAVKEPTIPDHKVGVADFGAVPDGKTLNTEAIAKAIAALVAQGGGRVVFPAGMWLTGPIELKSNIELRTEMGALILFSSDIKQYANGKGPITGKDLENVAITGQGVFDGAGQVWRPVKRMKTTERQWNDLLALGGVLEPDGQMWWPSREIQNGRRPRLVRLANCRRVLVEGAMFQNSPSFGLDFANCEDLTIRGATVFNEWWAQNGDGIDLHSCRNVVIRGTRVNVGDDAICMKSNRGAPLENVLIEDCTVHHGHGGFVIGSEEVGGMHNIRVNNCLFLGTDTGLRFKSGRDRGSVVEKIDIRNIRMIDIPGEAILFDMYYSNQAPLDRDGNLKPPTGDVQPVTATTPQFHDIRVRDVICRGARRAILLQGLPEMPLKDIRLENVSISAERGVACMDTQDITLKNVEILNEKGPVVHCYASRNIAIDRLTYPAGAEALVRVQGKTNAKIVLSNTDAKAAKQAIEAVETSDTQAVRFE
jgi:polygalacturonase